MSHALDRNFLWEAVSIYVNDILFNKRIYEERLDIKNIVSNVHDNIFEFTLTINAIPCKFLYIFDSNVSIEGTLEIANLETGESQIFNVERLNDCVRIGKSLTTYHEVYIYNEVQVIDVSVEKGVKTNVTDLTITTTDVSSGVADILNMSVQDNRLYSHNPLIERLLFAVSGAIDYDVTKCKDVIYLRSNAIVLVIYDSGSMQVISVDTKTSPNRATATIRPINSSFAQSYEYVIDKNTCHITEFIPTKNNPTAIRRQYVYRQDDKTKVITADGRKFSVALEDNNITFIRVD